VNYRHLFHAGNFADVVKHVVLVRALAALTAKDKPLCYVDSHAGRGDYDLLAEGAQRTGEFRSGVARLLTDPPPGTEVYVDLVRRRGDSYPGSPWLAAALCRPDDRLILVEKHPEEAAALGRLLGRDPRVHRHLGDGYERLPAVLPPPERRGLVLIDPPFEQPDEFDRLGRLVPTVWRRWPQASYLVWYPVKDPAAVAAFQRGLRDAGIRRLDALTFQVRAARAGDKLASCGLTLINLPFAARGPLAALLPLLAERLADGDGAGARLETLVGE
jgi:23S rRNA (adenine2030-N6)-methyltransferase